MPHLRCLSFYRFFILSLVLLLTACGQDPAPWQTKDMTGYMPNLSFTLTDANHNKTVSAEDLQGKFVALNFGFTHCPDVCPMALHQMQSALSKLTESELGQVQVLFATVDPKRDGVAEMKAYAESFGDTIGLTGDEATLAALAKQYKVSVGFGKPNEQGHYDVSHSIVTYVFDRQGAARLLVRPDNTPDGIASDLSRLIAEQS